MKKAVLLALLLAGCASRQEIAAVDDDTCQSYGAAYGSPAYIQCRMQRDQLRQQDRTARAAAVLSQPDAPIVFVNPGTGRRF